ncbi:MAG: hypothetical protein F4077_07050 [Gammaproteobacteria bacterium]|nr:hypothetical protein [Gammaproteobacteria bacterium]
MKEQEPNIRSKRVLSLLFKTLTWLLAAGCFYWVYTKIAGAAAKENISAWRYLLDFFRDAFWLLWLLVMMPYSVCFFLVDSNVTWRVLRWFNAPELKYGNVLPIRASAYILSLVNEQVGKGAMSLYLLKTHQVPGWKALSSMIFIGVCEIYQLLLFSSVGLIVFFGYVQQASTALPLDFILPAVFIFAFVYFPFHLAYFRGYIFKEFKLRNLSVLHALREAKFHHYVLTILFKAPNMIGAVFVYTIALAVFNVQANTGQILVFLPLIFLAAALPLPFHAGALVIWTVVFPEYPEVGAFSLVMHTFFVIFNALIGVCFLPRANRELFDQ